MTASDSALGTIIHLGEANRGTRFLQTGWSATLTGLVRIAPQRRWGFSLGGTFSAREGFPLPLATEIITEDGIERFVGVSRELDDFRLSDIYLLDLRLEKEIRLREGLALSILVDAFNLTNDTAVQSRVENLSLTQALWAQDTISPRVYRLGLRLRWN